jgi:hypothetical protein
MPIEPAKLTLTSSFALSLPDLHLLCYWTVSFILLVSYPYSKQPARYVQVAGVFVVEVWGLEVHKQPGLDMGSPKVH